MDSDDYNFPRTYQDFRELGEYLNYLKSNLEGVDPATFENEMYESYKNILSGIESALTLAELDQMDNVLHVRDARFELEKVFGKPIN